MGLCLKKNRDGKVRPWWYGEFVRRDGSRAVVNLNVAFEGKPPASGKVADTGNTAFERSRARAFAALEEMRREEAQGRVARSVALRRYRETTGEKLEAVPVASLVEALRRRSGRASEEWKQYQIQRVKEFAAWVEREEVSNVMDIKLDHAKRYLAWVYDPKGRGYTAGTVKKIKVACAMAMDEALPGVLTNEE